MPRQALWDVFCQVIDHWGDIGVCWRLAADLSARGQRVRLWVDDASALAWMAPSGAPGVEVRPWQEAAGAAGQCPGVVPGDVVVEAFACNPPEAFVAAMATRSPAPVWFNLEYLSAEPWVERCHGLPSPQMTGPGRGLTKWFFQPGFTRATGGLIREPRLLDARRAFDRDAWLVALGIARRPDERVVTVFCYPHAPLHGLPEALAAGLGSPVLCLLTAGPAQALVSVEAPLPAGMRAVALPHLDQPDFDRLLWCSDLAFVRGEDSAVRAIWAGVPFVWQLYRQQDGAHLPKMEAFLAHWRDACDPAPDLMGDVAGVWRWWNGAAPEPVGLGVGPRSPVRWPDMAAWRGAAHRFSEASARLPDLTGQLIAVALEKAPPEGPAG